MRGGIGGLGSTGAQQKASKYGARDAILVWDGSLMVAWDSGYNCNVGLWTALSSGWSFSIIHIVCSSVYGNVQM